MATFPMLPDVLRVMRGMAEFAIVCGKDSIRFTMKNGTEIKA